MPDESDIHIVRAFPTEESAEPSSQQQIYVPQQPSRDVSGYQRGSGGLLFPNHGSVWVDDVADGERTPSGLIIQRSREVEVDEAAVRAGIAAEKASHMPPVDPGKILVSEGYLGLCLQQRGVSLSENTDEVLGYLGGKKHGHYSKEAVERKVHQTKDGREVSSPGVLEEVMLACMDVVRQLNNEPIRLQLKEDKAQVYLDAAKQVLRQMYGVLQGYAVEIEASGALLPQMPDFAESCLEMMKDLVSNRGERKLFFDIAERMDLTDAQKEKFLDWLDYYDDLDHPLAFALFVDLKQRHPENKHAVLQRRRIEDLSISLMGSPQELLDDYPRLLAMAKRIIYIGPPLITIDGKVGLELEYIVRNNIKPPARFENHDIGDNDTVRALELTRSDKKGSRPDELEYTTEYVADLSPLRRWFIDAASVIGTLHFHLDKKRHPYKPELGEVLGNNGRYARVIEEDRNHLPTFEIRGLFPPLTADGTLDPAMLNDIYTMYILTAEVERFRNMRMDLDSDKDYSADQLVFGHIVNFLGDPVGRLVALHILQRDRYRDFLMQRQNPPQKHNHVFDGVNPYALFDSYDITAFQRIHTIFSEELQPTEYITDRLAILDIMLRLTDTTDWRVLLSGDPVENMKQHPMRYKEALFSVLALPTQVSTLYKVQIVAALESDPDSLRRLLGMLRDEVAGPIIAQTLAANKDLMPQLIPVLMDASYSQDVRSQILSFLVWNIGPGEQYEDILKQLVLDPQPNIRYSALSFLTASIDKYKDFLLHLLHTSSDGRVLREILASGVVKKEMFPEIEEDLLRLFNNPPDEDKGLREQIFLFLVQDPIRYRDIIQDVFLRGEDRESMIREAVRTFFKDTEGHAFIRKFLKDINDETAILLLGELRYNPGNFTHEELENIAAEEIKHTSPQRRESAVRLYGNISHGRSPVILEALHDASGIVRAAAVVVLAQRENGLDEQWLALANDPDEQVRSAVERMAEHYHRERDEYDDR